ncbi:monovalent cation/H+ antiporter complex subunit F [Nocardiopsis ansamitocini]|uniref:Pesticidal protein Cry26Aa n=1 Tax=Nocardiopsis ansamitocini TaxID=1670832 RepID=A0A9W6P5Z8_9ACTN|nr:monovalent cation/H+ antiporter complex subunit F [Nocardiopsis ansamitocini]GLU47820.1 hypothetical protein Nans01_21710 [Nocardiopsis ansamitocini]
MILINIALAAVVLAMVAALYRIAKGPSDADRGAGADLVFFGFVAVVALIGVRLDTDLVIDIALACALVGFLAALSTARLITGGKR